MAQIQKGTTYSTGDQVTATNLNALADAAILLPGAITDQTAKTVPLAADTVLIHSAADTALRKSTLTQLFANATGIPISTGISGLGTGIATALAVNTGSAGAPVLFNGALGTPASGTVTNLTGTASININGTVGATTPSTGRFTTVRLDNTDVLTWGGAYGAGIPSILGSTGAGELQFRPTGSTNGTVATISSTGLAVTGTLSATGLSTLSSGVAVRGNTAPASGAGLELVWDGTQSVIQSYNRTSPAYQPLWLEGGTLVRVGLGGTQVAGFSSTGLAVTGQVTASVTTTASDRAISGVNTNTSGTNYGGVFISSGTSATVHTGGYFNAAGATTNYGVRIAGPASGASSYAIYADATAQSYFAGNVGIGTTSPAQKLHVNSSSATVTPITTTSVTGDTAYQAILVTKFDNDSTTSQNFIQFQINNGGANCGKITANGANTAAFGSTSDRRVKENIADLPSQLANIMALRPVEFDYVESLGGGHQIGFVAQEMQQVYPDVIAEDSSEEKILSITGWSKTEARLVKALQELNANLVAQVAALSQRMAALESN